LLQPHAGELRRVVLRRPVELTPKSCRARGWIARQLLTDFVAEVI